MSETNKMNNLILNGQHIDLSPDYQNIRNKPKINGVDVEGNKTLADFGIATKESVETVSEKVAKLPYGIYYGQYNDVESLPDTSQLTQKGYAYVASSDPAVYYIYIFDGEGSAWEDSGNKFVTTALETDLETKSTTKAPTTEAVKEGIEAVDITKARTQSTELSAVAKYNAAANINDRAADVVAETGVVKALGYKVLNPELDFAEQIENVVEDDTVIVDNSNTVFEIRDEFDLDGDSVTIPTNCTLKFNGGRVINGHLLGDFAVETNDYQAIGDAFSIGYNIQVSEDFLKASTIGMKEGESNKNLNGAILTKVILQKKCLELDGEYHFCISSKYVLDYNFCIKGGIMHTHSNMFTLAENGGVTITNTTLIGHEHQLINTSSVNYLINNVVFENCTFENFIRVVQLVGSDKSYCGTITRTKVFHLTEDEEGFTNGSNYIYDFTNLRWIETIIADVTSIPTTNLTNGMVVHLTSAQQDYVEGSYYKYNTKTKEWIEVFIVDVTEMPTLTPFGVRTFRLIDCTFNTARTQFPMTDIVFVDKFVVSGNVVNGMQYTFMNVGTNNDYQNTTYNKFFQCDFVVDNNHFKGVGYLVCSDGAYYTPLVAEGKSIVYSNNIIENMIADGTYPAYDGYLSCDNVVFRNNIITDVISLYHEATTSKAYTEIAKSKAGGLTREIVGNTWDVDGVRCRKKCVDVGITYTDTEFENTAYIDAFGYTGALQCLNFCNNTVRIKNAKFCKAWNMGVIVDNATINGNIFDITEQGNAVLLSVHGGYYDLTESKKTFSFCNNTINATTGMFQIFSTMSGIHNAYTNSYVTIINNISNVLLSPTTSGKSCIFKNNKVTSYPTPANSVVNYSDTADVYDLDIPCSSTNENAGVYVPTKYAKLVYDRKQYDIISFYIPANNRKIRMVAEELGLDRIFYIKESGSNVVIYDDFYREIASGGKATDWTYYVHKFSYYAYIALRNMGNGQMRVYVRTSNKTYSYKIVFFIETFDEDIVKKLLPVRYDDIIGSYTILSNDNRKTFTGRTAAKDRGTTNERPTSLVSSDAGFMFYDTDLSKPIYWNGSAWIDGKGETLGLQVPDTSVLIGAAADSSVTINVYHANALTVSALNPDNTPATWLTVPSNIAVGTNTLTISAAANTASNPRGAKVIISDGTDVVIVNVVQNYTV